MKKTYDELIKGLKEEVKKTGMTKAVIGLSGGIDSAVTLKIAVDALGAENVTAILMPEIGLTNQVNTDHAKLLADHFGVTNYLQPINSLLISFGFVPWGQSQISQMNLRARIRMTLLYHYANTVNALVLGTSNKSEILLGYGTKFGDLAADIEVIGSLWKTDVIAIAKHIGLPQELIDKKPSAELTPGQNDEDELGAPYTKLDLILRLYEEGLDADEIISRGFESALTQKTLKRVAANEHKRALPPVIEISKIKKGKVTAPKQEKKTEPETPPPAPHPDQQPLF